MNFLQLNSHDLQLVHHLEQSKMITKDEMNRQIHAIYSKHIRDIQHWLRDRDGLSWANEPLDLSSTGQSSPTRRTVYNHYSRKHKRTLNCQHCHYRTTTAIDHESFLKEVANLSPRQATSKAQANRVTKQFITVHLQCPLSECPDTFTEDQLNQHMLDKHDIGSNRCLVKDCAQSFDNRANIRHHIEQFHQHMTPLHCSNCSKHFTKYCALYTHNYQYHQLGQFVCSFPDCTFTGEYKMKMYNHYTQHKPKLVKARESANQTVAHSADPKDYLEVASELL